MEPSKAQLPSIPSKYQKAVRKTAQDRIVMKRRNRKGEVIAQRIQVVNTRVTGRNEPCICGSGKKFKKCCMT